MKIERKPDQECLEQCAHYRRKIEVLAVEYAAIAGGKSANMTKHLRILEYQNRLAALEWALGLVK